MKETLLKGKREGKERRKQKERRKKGEKKGRRKKGEERETMRKNLKTGGKSKNWGEFPPPLEKIWGTFPPLGISEEYPCIWSETFRNASK